VPKLREGDRGGEPIGGGEGPGGRRADGRVHKKAGGGGGGGVKKRELQAPSFR